MGDFNKKGKFHHVSVLSFKEPYEDLAFSQIAIEVVGGFRPTIPSSCSRELENLICACWNQEPTVRPAFDEIVQSLENISWDNDGKTEISKVQSVKKDEMADLSSDFGKIN